MGKPISTSSFEPKPKVPTVPEGHPAQTDAIPGATAQDADTYFATHTPALAHEPATPEPPIVPATPEAPKVPDK